MYPVITQKKCNTENAFHLKSIFEDIDKACIRCGRCVTECSFLKQYSCPGDIAEYWSRDDNLHQILAYSCSLCDLCSSVCPQKLHPKKLFLEMRRQLVTNGTADLSPYHRLLAFEKRGMSNHFSFIGLSRGCDTVFFPGCNLPGSRPELTLSVWRQLQIIYPRVGIVLNCCGKPSHDLGRQTWFQEKFASLQDQLLKRGIKKVIVACPSCFSVFHEYGSPLQVVTVYEKLLNSDWMDHAVASPTLSVHDACVTRFEGHIQEAVRGLIGKTGNIIEEEMHSRKKTVCCGEGGAVSCCNSLLSRSWRKVRLKESAKNHVITYCGGCQETLGQVLSSSHILDFIRDPEASIAGKVKVDRYPVTYWNRLRMKQRLEKHFALHTKTNRNTKPSLPMKIVSYVAVLLSCVLMLWQ